MKKIFSGFSIENICNNLISISRRFPLCFVIIFFITGVFLLLTHGDFSQKIESDIMRLNLSLIITFFLSLWVYIAAESYSLSYIKKQAFQVWVLLYWMFFYLWFHIDPNSFETPLYFIIQLIGIITFLFFAPYTQSIIWWKWEQDVYYRYFYRMATVFATALILWWVLFMLWSIGIWAITALFDIWRYMDQIYIDWAIFSLSFFTPMFALTQIPDANSYNKSSFRENNFFSFLIKFACLPAIVWYFIILYSYTIKVLLNFSHWPKWEVSWLVIGFSIFWYTLYIFSYSLEKEHWLIKKFRFIFPYIVLPQIAMLFYAIYLRISQYDLTINRYFVIVFGVWLTLISLYLIFSRQRYLAIIPAVITLFTIVISIWPWSVYNLPESRQLERLKSNLITANILEWTTITPLSSYDDISSELSGEIYSGIEYLCRLNDCQSIKILFPLQYAEVENENILKKESDLSREYRLSYRRIVEAITNTLKVKNKQYSDDDTPYVSGYVGSSDTAYFPLNLEEFDQLIRIKSQYDSVFDTKLYWYIDTSQQSLSIRVGEKILETISLAEVFSQLQNSEPFSKGELLPSQMTFDIQAETYDIRLLIESFSLLKEWKTQQDVNFVQDNIYGYALIRKK